MRIFPCFGRQQRASSRKENRSLTETIAAKPLQAYCWISRRLDPVSTASSRPKTRLADMG
jgi:hypothetical protein